jgi:hypothetical protein
MMKLVDNGWFKPSLKLVDGGWFMDEYLDDAYFGSAPFLVHAARLEGHKWGVFSRKDQELRAKFGQPPIWSVPSASDPDSKL